MSFQSGSSWLQNSQKRSRLCACGVAGERDGVGRERGTAASAAAGAAGAGACSSSRCVLRCFLLRLHRWWCFYLGRLHHPGALPSGLHRRGVGEVSSTKWLVGFLPPPSHARTAWPGLRGAWVTTPNGWHKRRVLQHQPSGCAPLPGPPTCPHATCTPVPSVLLLLPLCTRVAPSSPPGCCRISCSTHLEPALWSCHRAMQVPWQ